ncbi:MAG: DinB family protein [Anaerolineae bacterium]
MIVRPNTDEYAEFYAGYVARVPDGDVLQFLREQPQRLRDLLRGVSEEQAAARPAPKEWSIKEVISHLNDGERVFSYRALRFSRGDETALPGFDQDLFVENSNSAAVPLADLLDEFAHLRAANLLLYTQFQPETLARRGTASNYPVSVRGLVYITAGHVEHHYESLRTVYLKQA